MSSSDLIHGLAPSATDYVGCCEASGGTTVPFTDGSTGVGISDPTSASNSLFEIGNLWFVTYTLPGTFDLTSIVVTTGHQDSRVNQHYDIFTSNGGPFISLSGGAGFSYTPSGGNGGAAQSTITDDSGFLATGVTAVRFVAGDGGNDVFREVDVQGIPEPTIMALGLVSGLGLLGTMRRRRA